MKFLADTADINELRSFAKSALLDGVTTNPSIIAKSGRPIHQVTAEICSLTEGPIRAEVVSTEPDAMVAAGRELAALAENDAVKVPPTEAGLAACRAFRGQSSALTSLCAFH